MTFDSQATFGNSGGAIVNEQGQLVAVASSVNMKGFYRLTSSTVETHGVMPEDYFKWASKELASFLWDVSKSTGQVNSKEQFEELKNRLSKTNPGLFRKEPNRHDKFIFQYVLNAAWEYQITTDKIPEIYEKAQEAIKKLPEQQLSGRSVVASALDRVVRPYCKKNCRVTTASR